MEVSFKQYRMTLQANFCGKPRVPSQLPLNSTNIVLGASRDLKIIIARLTNCLTHVSPFDTIFDAFSRTGRAFAYSIPRFMQIFFYVLFTEKRRARFKKIYARCRIIKCGTNSLTFEMCWHCPA